MEEQLFLAIEDLQQPYRDTLAFLMLHWQRIAQSPEVKMSINNIAVVFAPTLFDDVHMDLSNIVLWQQVLRVLLLQSSEFWAQFLEVEPLTPAYSIDDLEWKRETNQSPSLHWQSVKTYFRSMVSDKETPFEFGLYFNLACRLIWSTDWNRLLCELPAIYYLFLDASKERN